MRPVIRGLAFRLGAERPLDELRSRGVAEKVIAELKRRGQRQVPVAASIGRLLTESIAATLETAGLEPEEIDRILVTSESIHVSGSKADHDRARAELYAALVALGLGHAPVLLLTFAGCSSAISALEMAQLLAAGEESGHVLVVAADRVLDESERVLRPTVSVIGDGVASCVVGRSASAGGLRLRWTRHRAFLNAAVLSTPEDFGPSLVLLGRALNSLRKEMPEPSPEALLVCNNYGLPTLQLFARLLEVDEDRIYTDNVPRTGHIGSPDILVNLATAAPLDREVLVYSTGPADCALGLLEPVAELPS